MTIKTQERQLLAHLLATFEQYEKEEREWAEAGRDFDTGEATDTIVNAQLEIAAFLEGRPSPFADGFKPEVA